MKNNYKVEYCQGSSGFANSFECDLREARKFVEEHKKNYTTAIRVWSIKQEDFVYWKDVLQYDYNVKEEDKKLLHRDFDLRKRI